MRANEFSLPSSSKIIGSLQLYVPRPKNVNEILKPISGFMYSVTWTSTAKKQGNGYTSAWVEWCKTEMPHWLTDKGILYKVSSSARILSMNTDKDAFMIAKHYGVEPPKTSNENFTWAQEFPWDDIQDDYDGIHHVPVNRGSNVLMSSWDVESTAWLDTNHLQNLGEVKVNI